MSLLNRYEKNLWPVVEGRYEVQLEGLQRIYHKILKSIRPVSYPLKGAYGAWKATRRYGTVVEERASVSIWRQLVHQLLLYVEYGLPPIAYYNFRLFFRRNRKEAQFYVHHKQMDVLLGGLHILSDAEAALERLRDKVGFFNHCEQHGIPAPPVLLSFQEGNVVSHALSPKEPLPQQSLFSKPVRGEQGMGARRWSYVENEKKYRNREEGLFTGMEVKTALKRRSKDRDIILQTQIQNHPKLESLAGGTLCAARMVTGRLPGGRSQHLISSLRLSVNGGVTSNFSAGGIGAPIESSTGRLGRGCFKEKIGERELGRHPSTGKKIVGFRLPDWQEAVRLVERAHNTLSELHFVGWDVAFTESGPLILEGNAGFGAEVLQIPHRQPLGLTEFADYYSACLEHYM